MNQMIQKFQLFLNIHLTKKIVSKTYPFGRSSDDRQTDIHTHRHTRRKNDPYMGFFDQ